MVITRTLMYSSELEDKNWEGKRYKIRDCPLAQGNELHTGTILPPRVLITVSVQTNQEIKCIKCSV